jgi:hypothetical protein
LAAGFEYQTRVVYDYFDVQVDYAPGMKLPRSFVGISGGAVWRLANPFGRNPPMPEFKSTDYVLAGVAFWQDLEGTHQFIAPADRNSFTTSSYQGYGINCASRATSKNRSAPV